MSHKATTWLSELPASAMTSGEFRVLFHLCDCHNPSNGCFPSQDYLRTRTGLSNGGLNNALNGIESKALIERRRRFDEKTRRPLSTRYTLKFEADFNQKPTPLSGEGAVSTSDADPSPLSGQSHLHPSGDKPAKEPTKEPVCNHIHPRFEEFWKAHPRNHDRASTERLFFEAIAAGADPQHVIQSANKYRQENSGNSPQYLKYSDTWLQKKCWMDFEFITTAKTEETDIAAFWAEKIKAGAPISPTAISPRIEEEIIARGLVEPSVLRDALRGVRMGPS